MSPGDPTDGLARVRRLLDAVLPVNAFYADKFADRPVTTWEDFTALPFTTKAELLTGSNRTLPVERYARMHQTSGTTTGKPLRVYDTTESWRWLKSCWGPGYETLGITAADRLFFPFSFGPFLGFWVAFEAATDAGIFTLPGGGQSSAARLRAILDHDITTVFCTPTYGLHLAEVAVKEGIDLAGSTVKKLVVAGEPGGSMASLRGQLEAAWGARVLDHYGLTEVGPIAFEPANEPGVMTVCERDFVIEVIDANAEGVGELVVTNLGRLGCPVIRYRTGDLVKLVDGKLVDGVLGRVDDMLHVRGNNVYPTAIEAIVRRFPDVAEYLLTATQDGPLVELALTLETLSDGPAGDATARDVQQAIQRELLFRVEVCRTPPGNLPRHELKARRFVRIPREKPTASD